jgi:hypothetical protein
MTAYFVPMTILGLALPRWVCDVPRLSVTNGPFMVNACLFEGPDAESLARSAAREFRDEYSLPAYILGNRSQGRERFVVWWETRRRWPTPRPSWRASGISGRGPRPACRTGSTGRRC